MNTKHNPISTALCVLGISVVVSIALLTASRFYMNHRDAMPAHQAQENAQMYNASGAFSSAIYAFSHSSRIYPVLTWSIAGAIILVIGIATVFSHGRVSRMAIISVLYLVSAVAVTKAAAVNYCNPRYGYNRLHQFLKLPYYFQMPHTARKHPLRAFSSTIFAVKHSKQTLQLRYYESTSTSDNSHRDNELHLLVQLIIYINIRTWHTSNGNRINYRPAR